MSRAERTRQVLQETALSLFTERGFDEVTVEEIAHTAGVSHMTFYRNFPTKESVVLDDPYDPLIGNAITAEDHGLPAVERVRRALARAWESVDPPNDDSTRARVRLAAGHPSLRALIWQNNQRTENVIVDALTSSGVHRLEARVAAGSVLGALTAALFDWAESDDATTLGARILTALDMLKLGVSTGQRSDEL